MSEQRIPSRPRADWDSAVLEAMSTLGAPRSAGAPTPPAPSADSESGERPNIVGILAWHPALMKGYFAFNGYLFHSTLSDRIRELVILRTAWVRRNEYVWTQHVRIGRAADVTESEIEALAQELDPRRWDLQEAAVLRAVEEICEERCVSDATWDALSIHLDRQQVMDLVFTVGAYDLLSVAMNSFGLNGFPPEGGA